MQRIVHIELTIAYIYMAIFLLYTSSKYQIRTRRAQDYSTWRILENKVPRTMLKLSSTQVRPKHSENAANKNKRKFNNRHRVIVRQTI